MTKPYDLQVPFGAVYFRKSNPPQRDWENDYGIAAEDGLNVFRHWFIWSAIERAPGKYDWGDYDRQMDLAAENGIKTIIAELTQAVPEWAYRRWAHARQKRMDGSELALGMGPSSSTGGFAHNGGGAGALTMNCKEVNDAVCTFLTEMAKRYKGHPGLLGYDIWNECNYSPLVDYSDYTKSTFRNWLKEKYGDLEALSQAWHRYGHAEWDDVEPPVQMGPYPEALDWLQFKKDNFYDQMQVKIDTIRTVDADCLIAAHGIAGAIYNAVPGMNSGIAAGGCDDWLAASKVQVYGYTWVQARKGAQPWRNFYGGDLNRAAARGKTFWHAERQGGPLWMQPQLTGRDKEDGRIPDPQDIRVWSLSSFATGARGMMNLRYRPLLDGPLFGAFGSYGMDGSRTDRSAMASQIAKWTNARETAACMAAKPVQGDIGILVVPETQQWDYLLSNQGGFDTYTAAMWGAYRGFFDNNIQADWVHIDDMEQYDTLYYPYPIMFTQAQADRIAAWVKRGGTLICEACPGYFGDRGKVGTVQPNMGLDSIFGVREDEVEFMPDIGDRIRFTFDGLDIQGGGFLQSYVLVGAQEMGRFADGRIAMAAHAHGKGRTLLIGTNPSVGYYKGSARSGRDFFAAMLNWAGGEQAVRCTNPEVQARLHETDGRRFLWVVNPTRIEQTGNLSIRAEAAEAKCSPLWPAEKAALANGRFTIGERDALVIEIR